MVLCSLAFFGFTVFLVLFSSKLPRRRTRIFFGAGTLLCLALFIIGTVLVSGPKQAPIQFTPLAPVQEALPSDTTSDTIPEPPPDAPAQETPPPEAPASADYVLNTNSKKFHLSSCGNAARISEANRAAYTGTRDDLLAQGYTPLRKL